MEACGWRPNSSIEKSIFHWLKERDVSMAVGEFKLR